MILILIHNTNNTLLIHNIKTKPYITRLRLIVTCRQRGRRRSYMAGLQDGDNNITTQGTSLNDWNLKIQFKRVGMWWNWLNSYNLCLKSTIRGWNYVNWLNWWCLASCCSMYAGVVCFGVNRCWFDCVCLFWLVLKDVVDCGWNTMEKFPPLLLPSGGLY